MAEGNPLVAPQRTTTTLPRRRQKKRGLGWLLFSFKGRIPRRQFWGALLGAGLVIEVLWFMAIMPIIAAQEDATNAMYVFAGVVYAILYIPATWTGLAIMAKRFHDRGKSGWWVLIQFVPLIGVFWLFIECGFLRGTVGPNQYGARPNLLIA